MLFAAEELDEKIFNNRGKIIKVLLFMTVLNPNFMTVFNPNFNKPLEV